MSKPPDSLQQSAAGIQLLALDVDGVLTDGKLYFGTTGEAMKSFSTLDGLGIKMLQRSGIEVVVITARQSSIVKQRAAELGIDAVLQGREDKCAALAELLAERQLSMDQAAYVGDDLPDLAAICSAGLGIAPANANAAVRERADWVTQQQGGAGAVREVAELILQAQEKLDALIASYQ